MDFTLFWLSKACCDEECACVMNYGCHCTHDCQCPDKSLPHTIESKLTDSLAIKMHNYTKTTKAYATMNLEGGTFQEPVQVGYDETKEPGIVEPEDAVDAPSLRKGGGAAWAQAQGSEPESGDWQHPKHWIRPNSSSQLH